MQMTKRIIPILIHRKSSGSFQLPTFNNTNVKKTGPRNCRYCIHRLAAEAKRCPACKRSQSRIGEYFALLLGNHAVLCIRGDRSGMITLANWGQFSHGRLVNRPDGQWFIPRDPSQHELRINNLTTLIPFTPKGELF